MPVARLAFVLTAHVARRRVRGNSLLSQVSREVLASAAARFLVDAEPLAVFVLGFGDHVDVRVLLVAWRTRA